MGDVARTYWTDERLDSAFGELRQELREFRMEVRSDMTSLRTELRADSAGFRGDVHRELADLRRQALAASVAIIVALLGVVGAVLVAQ